MNDDIRRKVYIEVVSRTDTEGKIMPISFKWENDTVYQIDEVKDVRRAASTRAGGIGIRYLVRIENHETYLYYEDIKPFRWFVISKSE